MKLSRLLSILVVPLIALSLTACGDPAEVPPAYVGKLLGRTGMNKEVIKPSKFRFDVCWFYCESLVLVEASDQPIEERMEIFIPHDKLILTVDLRGVLQINDDDKDALNKIYDRVPSKQTNNSRVRLIDLEDVYAIYGRNHVRSIVRNIVSQYSITQSLDNREKLEAEIYNAMIAAMAGAPIRFIQLGLAAVTPPQVIVESQIKAEQRRIEIQEAEARKQVAIIDAQRDLEVAERDRAVRITKARTTEEENSIIARSVSPEWLAVRYLEVVEAIGNQPSTVFFPLEMINAPGLSNRIFGESAKELDRGRGLAKDQKNVPAK